MTDYHQIAREFMARNRRKGWRVLSLDEWLSTYRDRLPDDTLEEGYALLENFTGYGGKD